MATDIRVTHYENQGRVSIYDKLGGGHVSLEEDEAEYVLERLKEELEDG